MKDWLANTATIAATNGRRKDAQEHDYYATDPVATDALMQVEEFDEHIWEPACGEGHMAEVIKKHGYDVFGTDLIDRGYGAGGVDFLTTDIRFDGDIITNPPYKYATEFAERALKLTKGKVAMFLKLTFLESQKREELFRKHPPKYVYVFTRRVQCVKNGDFEGYAGRSSATAYAWFVWEKGYTGEPVIRWLLRSDTNSEQAAK